jgi:hypothetical protein
MASLFSAVDYSTYTSYNFSSGDSFTGSNEFLTRDMRGGKHFGIKDALSIGAKVYEGDLEGAVKEAAIPLAQAGIAGVANLFRNKENPLSTPTYMGEVRLPLKADYAPEPFTGKRMLANYAGPGTHFLKRVKLGHKPISLLDRISQAHDARYSLANTVEDVRKADQIFMERLEKEKKNLHPMEYKIAKTAFDAKMAAEDMKLLSSQNDVLVANAGESFTNADREQIQGVLDDLIQKGEGKKDSEIAPSIRLARSIATEGLDKAVGAVMKKKLGSRMVKGKGLKLAGQGLNLAGQGVENLIPFLKKARSLHQLFVNHIRKFRPSLVPTEEKQIEGVVDAEFPTHLSKLSAAVKRIAEILHKHFGLPDAPAPDATEIQHITDQAAVAEGSAGRGVKRGVKTQLKKIGKRAFQQAKRSAGQIVSDASTSLGSLVQSQAQNLDSRIQDIVRKNL